MKDYQRQLFLLIGFMTLLVVVTLFLFVYAPEPVSPPSLHVSIPVPDPVSDTVNASVNGYQALYGDLLNASNAFNLSG